MSGFSCLVVAKAPLAGRVKTRLGREIGMAAAAELAAAALLDTLEVCAATVGAHRCSLALDGELQGAVRGEEIAALVEGWRVFPQRGTGLGERLSNAHTDAGSLPRVQVGMDTPQITSELLRAVAGGLVEHEASLAPAADGGWWALALRGSADASSLADVPMSTPTTGADTRAALLARGLTVDSGPLLCDVDTVEDAILVAELAPWTRFAVAWDALRRPTA